MTAGQTYYEASSGFETPWDKLSLVAQARWERWASSNHSYIRPETVNTGVAGVVEMAFQGGLNIMLHVSKHNLGDWGGPDIPQDILGIKLDAEFHSHMNPQFTNTHLKVTLSFDTLREVIIPWAAVLQCIVVGNTPTPVEAA